MTFSFTKKVFFTFTFAFSGLFVQAQSTLITAGNSGNIAVPELTYEQIIAIANPKKGMVAYDNSFNCLRFYNGTNWKCSYSNPVDMSGSMTAFPGDGNGGMGRSIAVDNSFVYATGQYEGTVNFGSYNLTTSGSYNPFIVKYDKLGNVIWAKRGGGSSLVVDASGNIYTTGYFAGSATFDGQTINSIGANNDFYIAKYGSDGTLLALSRFGSAGSEVANKLILDKSGNVIITGSFTKTFPFGAGSVTTYTNSNSDIDTFIAKLDINLNPTWITRGGGDGYDFGNGLAVDSQNNIYGTGVINGNGGNVDFSGTIIPTAGEDDLFIVKLDPTGSLQWLKSIGGSTNDRGTSITIDGNDTIYVGGYFNSPTLVIDGVYYQTKGSYDIITVRCNTSGIFTRIICFGGTSNDYLYDIKVGKNNEVAIVGGFSSSLNLGIPTIVSKGLGDVFYARINSEGTAGLVQTAGGMGNDFGNSIDIDQHGIMFLTGAFDKYGVFGNTILKGSVNSAIFVAKSVD